MNRIAAGQIPSQLNCPSESHNESNIPEIQRTTSPGPRYPRQPPNIHAGPSSTSLKNYSTSPPSSQNAPASSKQGFALPQSSLLSSGASGGPGRSGVPNFSIPTDSGRKAGNERTASYGFTGQSITSGNSRSRRPSQSARQVSSGGGLSVVLGETGSWSDLAARDNTLPADSKELLERKDGGANGKSGGMLGFLSRKKGRGHSPKPMERGILSSKEGGRVIIGTG